jgi:hypothetical protein
VRETIDEYERLARQAVRVGDYAAAEAYLRDILKLAPNNPKLKAALEDLRNRRSGSSDRKRKGGDD